MSSVTTESSVPEGVRSRISPRGVNPFMEATVATVAVPREHRYLSASSHRQGFEIEIGFHSKSFMLRLTGRCFT